MKNAPATGELDLDKVMNEANQRYAEMVGSPLHQIESRQAKAIVAALVNEMNRVLAQQETKLNFLASAFGDLDGAVDKLALAGGVDLSHPDRLGVAGE